MSSVEMKRNNYHWIRNYLHIIRMKWILRNSNPKWINGKITIGPIICNRIRAISTEFTTVLWPNRKLESKLRWRWRANKIWLKTICYEKINIARLNNLSLSASQVRTKFTLTEISKLCTRKIYGEITRKSTVRITIDRAEVRTWTD